MFACEKLKSSLQRVRRSVETTTQSELINLILITKFLSSPIKVQLFAGLTYCSKRKMTLHSDCCFEQFAKTLFALVRNRQWWSEAQINSVFLKVHTTRTFVLRERQREREKKKSIKTQTSFVEEVVDWVGKSCNNYFPHIRSLVTLTMTINKPRLQSIGQTLFHSALFRAPAEMWNALKYATFFWPP